MPLRGGEQLANLSGCKNLKLLSLDSRGVDGVKRVAGNEAQLERIPENGLEQYMRCVSLARTNTRLVKGRVPRLETKRLRRFKRRPPI